jgi:hypothetical protein
MVKVLVLLCSAVICLNAQTTTCATMFSQTTCSTGQTDYVSPIINAMKASAEAQSKAQQLKLQEEQLQLQRDRLELEQEKQQHFQQEQHAPEQQQKMGQGEINKTLQSLQDRYADFGLYENRMAELMNSFLPGKSITLYGYVEGLYLIAKHEKTESDPSAKQLDKPNGKPSNQ